MTRGKFVWDSKKNKMVRVKSEKKTSTHFVQGDEMEPLQSPISFQKKFFTSKSAYRRHLKENGFRETGGDHLNEKPETDEEKLDREYEEEIKQSYYDIKYDRIEFTEEQKALHEKERQQWKEKYNLKNPI